MCLLVTGSMTLTTSARKEQSMATEEPIVDLPAIPQKTCTKCGESKPETEFSFHRRPGAPNRRDTQCKACKSADTRQWAATHREHRHAYNVMTYAEHADERRAYGRTYSATHRESINAYNRGRYAANPEPLREKVRRYNANNLEQVRAAARERIAQDPQPNRARVKAWRKRFPEKKRAQNQAWDKANPEKTRNKVLRKRARRRGVPDTFTLDEQQFCRQYWQQACAVCGREEGFAWVLAFDHVIPLADPACPGTVASNMIVLCDGTEGCNSSKGAKPARAWLRERVGPRKAHAILKKIDAYFEAVRARQSHLSGLPIHETAEELVL
jgi:hypothetical protein